MRKLPKSSPWPFFAPASFRHRLQKEMTPLPFDHAEKKKFKLSLAYVVVSAIAFHYVIYEKFFKTKEDSVKDELSDEISTMMTIANVENPQGYVYSFNNFNLNNVEHFNKEEWVKKRQSASSEGEE